MDIFCNHTITVYGKAKFSASLSESDHVEHINQATCEDYFHQNMHDKKYLTYQFWVLSEVLHYGLS